MGRVFAHPWVYVVVLPAMGLVSDSLPIFCRRPLVGYVAVVIGTVTTMALGFGVWLHHMFATGIPFLALGFFSGASFVIAIPSAIAVFAWVATLWTGLPVMTSAFPYFAGFVVMFVIGGVSGVVTASRPRPGCATPPSTSSTASHSKSPSSENPSKPQSTSSSEPPSSHVNEC